MALNRRFDDFQPIELNATVNPIVWSKPSIFEVAVASRVETFSARTETAPASTDGLSIHACALERTMLVTITAPSPAHVWTRLSSKAASVAASDAETDTVPTAVTGVVEIDARTSLRRSL
jgi:hypothetical protein